MEVIYHAVPAWRKARGRRILMCVALPPTHIRGCTLYVGRSTMDEILQTIDDFVRKFTILCEHVHFGWKMGALGCLGKLLGRLWETKWPLEVTTVAPWGHFGGSWAAFGVPLGCSWGDSGGKKATREAPRRVTGPFGGPKGLWKGPGVILGVVLVSKKVHFEVSKP